MKLISFEKWFFDILTEEKEYIILYHTYMKFLGLRVCYMDVDMGRFENKGTDPVYRSYNTRLRIIRRDGDVLYTDRGVISVDTDCSSFHLSLKGVDLQLKINPEKPLAAESPGLTIRRTKGQYLTWKPLYIRNLITGRIKMGENELNIQDTGYADYVMSTFNPMKIPARKLYWGRLHSDLLDLTFSYVEGKDQIQKWHSLIIKRGEETRQIDHMQLQAYETRFHEDPGINCPASYKLEAWDESSRFDITIMHLKPAIISAFTDNPENVGRIGRTILKKIARNPRGIKFFSSAQLKITEKGKTEVLDCPLMIDEFVIFS